MNMELIIITQNNSATARVVVDPVAYPDNTVIQLTLRKNSRATHPLLILYPYFVMQDFWRAKTKLDISISPFARCCCIQDKVQYSLA